MAPPRHRDIAAFEARADTYEDGWRGRMHHDIASRTAALALEVTGTPARILDVGCGTGLVLRDLAARLPDATVLAGLDPASSMVAAARGAGTDARLRFETGLAEQLPYADASFDLVVTATSFDHWVDQGVGLAECARVLAPGGRLVLADIVSLWRVPTLVFARGNRARTRHRVEALLRARGLTPVSWRRLYATIVNAVVAER